MSERPVQSLRIKLVFIIFVHYSLIIRAAKQVKLLVHFHGSVYNKLPLYIVGDDFLLSLTFKQPRPATFVFEVQDAEVVGISALILDEDARKQRVSGTSKI